MAFDVVIRGGEVIDGTGRTDRYHADVGIQNGRVAGIGDLSDAETARTIDAVGHVVCPGFIDVHVHSENSLLGGRDQMGGLRQGVTTHLLAPDGFGWAGLSSEEALPLWHYTQFAYGEPLEPVDWPTIESYLDLFPGRSPANVYPQVPHCAVRVKAMGWDPGAPTPDQLKVMEAETRAWMEAGAGCLCLGLDYQPSANAPFEELVALCKVALEYDGIYAAHLRYQILGRERAWQEIIDLHRTSGIPVHVSHERVDGMTGPILEQAVKDGVDITFESYLYPAGMTHITMQLPMWVQSGSPDEVLERMRQPDTRRKALEHLKSTNLADRQYIGYTRSGRFAGMTLGEAARSVNKSNKEFAYDLVLDEDGIQAFVMFWPVPEAEVDAVLNRTAPHPLMMVASDGVYDCTHPHPRGMGCFAQMLRKFVRERGLLSLEEAVYKMSGFPAERYRLKDRGVLREGAPADVVVFDPQTVVDRATFEAPIQPPDGIPHVLVNGIPVIENHEPTAHRPGQVLRRG
ncbi:MAG: D-aminoacylase [Gemmatimonadetes bacterium]|nr:D-aminoacylase [Gemmatimonadota bacterium]MYG86014.1 D-aminoacylase [Gemmatimonadota bacterium]MYJ89121.1 D-aminoacylase [Gemmatimonadota bacterium]